MRSANIKYTTREYNTPSSQSHTESRECAIIALCNLCYCFKYFKTLRLYIHTHLPLFVLCYRDDMMPLSCFCLSLNGFQDIILCARDMLVQFHLRFRAFSVELMLVIIKFLLHLLIGNRSAKMQSILFFGQKKIIESIIFSGMNNKIELHSLVCLVIFRSRLSTGKLIKFSIKENIQIAVVLVLI